eukprot:TRINITY_DN2284_c0_g1_i4.p2 TRINITY_DN2284_c0_g1~~TRINITY_DN2284_c0_g1_i4.p2  ORF type:complete len:161 (+),score=10.53 TRINITY_DN2284_c0_g1_i4:73-555(+)
MCIRDRYMGSSGINAEYMGYRGSRERMSGYEEYKRCERSPKSPYRRSSRSASRERSGKRGYESVGKMFEAKERRGYAASQMEKNEILSSKILASRICYAYGVPSSATTNDILNELDRRRLAMPKDMQFFRRGNFTPHYRQRTKIFPHAIQPARPHQRPHT